MNEIEKQYQELFESYNPIISKIPGKEQCAIRMARSYLKTGKIWWFAWEVIGRDDDLFGSHRAPARLSELPDMYPMLFEKRAVGMYTVYRLRIELMSQVELLEMSSNKFRF